VARGDTKRRRSIVAWTFENRRTGGLTIAQVPNASLIVFIVAAAASHIVPSGVWRDTTLVAMYGGLLVWAGDEMIRGVNPFRRALGAVVAGATIASLVLR
jgi:hypothetical protein